MIKMEQRREGGNVGGELGLVRLPHGDYGRLLSGEQQPGERLGASLQGFWGGRGEVV
jgi:hypothetical protein